MIYKKTKTKVIEYRREQKINKCNFSERIFVGNKAKGRISKRVFQESKARQNFRKTNISYLLIRARACAADKTCR